MADLGPIPSPCTAVCRLGPDQVCDGCGRTIAEIVMWSALDEIDRERVLARVSGWIPRERPPLRPSP